jgi:hypothetical protein
VTSGAAGALRRPRALAAAVLPRPRAVAAAVLATLVAAPGAFAHGDAASHYLETEPLYPAFGTPPSQALELELLGLLQAAERRGYPIKVALVAAADLPDNPRMLRAPERYAGFVAGELEMAGDVRAPVLVVTPHGFGVAGRERTRYVSPGRARALAPHVAAPGDSGDAMARAAIAGVRRIARAGGHPLPADVPPAEPVGGTATAPAQPVGGLATAPPADTSGPWLPLAGLVLVAALAGLLVRSRARLAGARTFVLSATKRGHGSG